MKDKLSALLDGALEEHSTHAVLEKVRRDRALRAEWDTYCLIGDVIRGERPIAPDFVSRVMQGVESEPIRIAPASAAASAAGRRVWRAMMPLAASVMGIAAVGLVANALYSSEADPVVVAAGGAKPTASIVAGVPVAIRPASAVVDSGDPHREYVFAHQAMTVGGPIPEAIQYVRTVSDVGTVSEVSTVSGAAQDNRR